VNPDPYEPLTPLQVERRLRGLVTELSKAKTDLEQARNDEVDAKHAYQSARRRALLSADCPKVTRGGYTTAERDAWVDEQVAELEKVFDLAEVKRKTAEDHLRTVRDQSVVVTALAKSVNTAYQMAGVAG
jgi:hypothetical protein